MFALMKSWAAISGLVAPRAARRAMRSSCGVSSLRVSSTRWRAVSPVASSSALRARCEPVCADGAEELEGGAQVLPSVAPSPLPAQPFAQHEMRPSELTDRIGHAEMIDGLAIERFGLCARRHERLGAREEPELEVRTVDRGALREPFERSRARGDLARAGRGLDQVGEHRAGQEIGERVLFGRGSGAEQRSLVVPEAQLENPKRVLGDCVHCAGLPALHRDPVDQREVGSAPRPRVRAMRRTPPRPHWSDRPGRP